MNPDGTYTVLDPVDDGTLFDDVLLSKYIVFKDTDTVLDSKTFKEVDGNTRADLLDDLATTAKKVLKHDNDDRFDDNEFANVKTSTQGFILAGSGLSAYSYNLKTPFTAANKTADTVYVDYAGNYIDVDYNLGNIKVTTTGGSINIKNTKDTYELAETVNGVKTTYEYKAVISHTKNLTDGENYLYRWAKLSIYRKVKDADDSTYTNVTDSVGFGTKGCNKFVDDGSTSIEVLQKLSKPAATDEKVDGIKYPKESAIYFIADEDGNKEVIIGKSNATSDSANEAGTTYTSGKDTAKIGTSGTGFYSAYLSYADKKVSVENMNLKSKEGFNYIDLGDIESSDINVIDDGMCATGGYVWVLDDGYIKTFGADEKFTKLYKVDGSMNRMTIGNKDQVLLWNQNDEVYTIINNPVKAAATTTATTAAIGWAKATDGTWSYSKTGGVKATSWLQDGNNWCYLNTLGVMQTGWINNNGVWYYLNASGAMLANTTVDGYVLGANGAWVK